MTSRVDGVPGRGVQRKPYIALLEGDDATVEYLCRVLSERSQVKAFRSIAELEHALAVAATPDLLLLDWHIVDDGSEENALALLNRVRSSFPDIPTVMTACSAELKDVLAAARLGAVDVLLKPFSKPELDAVIQHWLNSADKSQQVAEMAEIVLGDDVSFVRSSKRMQEIESQCKLVARAEIPVLILGESGTGKEVAAMLIHKMSTRRDRTFLKVNCAAMPGDLLESELFGYEQGAFTGAVKSKPGKFELCNHGTIFLDEIGEMSPLLQAKLLQVLQDGSFSRLGGRSTVKVDVRVLAATNIDIKTSISEKTFRSDLYYRLNGFTVKMPPLRERTEEIPILAQYFMRRIATKCGQRPLPISPTMMQAMVSYPWPGNIRELESTIKRYFVLSDEQAVLEGLGLLPEIGSHARAMEERAGAADLKSLVRSLKGNAEAMAISQCLDANGWNRKAAARELQISYKALLYKIKQYNLTPRFRDQITPHRGGALMPRSQATPNDRRQTGAYLSA